MSVDRMAELRRRSKAIIETAVELEQAYPDGASMPPEVQQEIAALIRLVDRLEEELDRLEAKWSREVIVCTPRFDVSPETEYRLRLNRIAYRERCPTQEVIDTWTRAFGSERAPDLWWAMKDGC